MRQTVRAIFLNRDQRFLFVQHNERDPQNLGKWSTVGGGLNAGESHEDCLGREIEEELGADVHARIRIGPKLYESVRPDRIDHFYVVWFSGDDVRPIAPDEILAHRWYAIDELEGLPLFFGFERELCAQSSAYLNFEIRSLSHTPSDVEAVQSLFDRAPNYFKAVQNTVAAPGEANEAMTVRPPQTNPNQKHNLGVYVDSDLVGYIDLIDGYPSKKYAYLGLLLFREDVQKTGLGKSVFRKIETLVQSWPHIEILRLGVADSNDVTGFWQKMGFTRTGRVLPSQLPNIKAQIIEMEKQVSRHGSK